MPSIIKADSGAISGITGITSTGDNSGTLEFQATSGIIEMDNVTGALAMPVGTTAQRPGTPITGMQRWNSTLGAMEFYNGTAWATTFASPYTINYIVQGGGGGGGGNLNGPQAGGGGAGGSISGSITVTNPTSYPIVIGAGGSSLSNGAATTAFSLSSIGGGAGSATGAGASGGSGGGGNSSSAGGAGTSGQGNAGGTGTNNGTNFGAGGGGGATSVGGNGSTTNNGTGGIGGTGLSFVSGFGFPVLYGCGGGGASREAGGANSQIGYGGIGATLSGTSSGTVLTVSSVSSGSIVLGQWIFISNSTAPVFVSSFGTGTGGAGTYNLSGSYTGNVTVMYNGGMGGGENTGRNGYNAAANTGSGGGGAHGFGGNTGGNGASGVVVISYSGAQRGIGGTVTSVGGNTFHTFTSSGTYTA